MRRKSTLIIDVIMQLSMRVTAFQIHRAVPSSSERSLSLPRAPAGIPKTKMAIPVLTRMAIIKIS